MVNEPKTKFIQKYSRKHHSKPIRFSYNKTFNLHTIRKYDETAHENETPKAPSLWDARYNTIVNLFTAARCHYRMSGTIARSIRPDSRSSKNGHEHPTHHPQPGGVETSKDAAGAREKTERYALSGPVIGWAAPGAPRGLYASLNGPQNGRKATPPPPGPE